MCGKTAASKASPPHSSLQHPNIIGVRDAFVRPSATGQCRLIGGKLVNLSVVGGMPEAGEAAWWGRSVALTAGLG